MESLRKYIESVVSLTDEEFEYVASHFQIKKLRKHSFLVQEGDLVENDYFVVKGCLKAYFYDEPKAKEYIYQFAIEDWWITDRDAYFKKDRATVTIDCLEDSELLSLSLHNREKLCAEMHKMEHFFCVKASLGYASLQKRILSLIRNNAKERYALFMQQYPHLLQRIPKTLIASYLGISRETLSRLYS